MSKEVVRTRETDMAVGSEGVVPGATLPGGGEANPVVMDGPASRGGAEGATDASGGIVVGAWVGLFAGCPKATPLDYLYKRAIPFDFPTVYLAISNQLILLFFKKLHDNFFICLHFTQIPPGSITLAHIDSPKCYTCSKIKTIMPK